MTEGLIAILDLITGYPQPDDAFIGWFMVDAKKHRSGIGSNIFADIRAALKAAGYDYISLACFPENVEAKAFWETQGFAPVKESVSKAGKNIMVYGRDI